MIVVNTTLNSFEAILYTFCNIKNVILSSSNTFFENNIKIAFLTFLVLTFNYF